MLTLFEASHDPRITLRRYEMDGLEGSITSVPRGLSTTCTYLAKRPMTPNICMDPRRINGKIWLPPPDAQLVASVSAILRGHTGVLAVACAELDPPCTTLGTVGHPT